MILEHFIFELFTVQNNLDIVTISEFHLLLFGEV